MIVLGTMSGSSLDGIDLACVKFHDQYTYELLSKSLIKYPQNILDLLYSLKDENLKGFHSKKYEYSLFVASQINSYLDSIDIDVDLISSHGHTVLHHPENGFSLQIGDGSVLSTSTGIDVACDFRSQDIALGGQGAPVVPIVEKMLFSDYKLFLNLGGIANISFHKSEEEIIAYDICGCNQILNFFAAKAGFPYDKDGELAFSGEIDTALLKFLSNHPYYEKDFPKSLDNQYVYSEFIYPIPEVIPPENIIHTYCHLIANKISEACQKLGIKNIKLLLSGGGTFNKFLVTKIQSSLSEFGIELVLPSHEIIEYKEAILMAHMGYLYYNDIPNTVSSATGSSSPWVSGSLYKGKRPWK